MFLYNFNRSGRNSKPAVTAVVKRYLTLRNLLTLVFLLALPFGTCNTLRLILSVLNSHQSYKIESFYYPTSIPWLKDSAKCENSGKTWDGEKCWDSEHSPMF